MRPQALRKVLRVRRSGYTFAFSFNTALSLTLCLDSSACAQVSAARRELVRELVRARRGDLPLMLDWSRCGSARSKVSHAWLQLAPDQGAISFKPLSCDSSTVSLAFDGTVAECPCMAVDTLVLLPGGMQQAASVEACAAPEAIAEVCSAE